MEFDLDDYRTQRLQRQKKRKQFINRFQIIKAKLGVSHPPPESMLRGGSLPEGSSKTQCKPSPPRVIKPPTITQVKQSATEQQQLQTENAELKAKLKKAQERSSLKMAQLKREIVVLKETYLKQMEGINQLSLKQKSEGEKKMKTLIAQIKDSETKNREIETTNKALGQEATQADKLFNGYLAEIEKEYKQKIAQFEDILKESSIKIEQMQKSFNEADLVENALKNDKLMESILASGKDNKGSVEDYRTLLQNKTLILAELSKTSKLKESEIKQIKQLTEKFKGVFEKLNSEKKQLLEDNVSMTNELLQIKKVFAMALGQAGQDVDQDEEDDDEEEEGEQEKAEAAGDSN